MQFLSKKNSNFAPGNEELRKLTAMINRVLIRLKVVQLLYSYLLTRSDFQIQQLPDNATRDRKFAQSVYVGLLEAILHMCGYRASMPLNAYKPLTDSAIGKALNNNADLKALADNDPEAEHLFDGMLANLLQQIVSSGAYRSYTHTRERDIPEDSNFWKITLQTLVAHSPEFEQCCRKCENFTIEGMQKGLELAIETLESVAGNRKSFTDALRSLESAMNKSRELYISLLWLPVELVRLQDERLEAARNRYLPTDEDLNPNLKFVNNAYVKAIAKNAEINEYLRDNPVSWADDAVMLGKMLDTILASDEYKKYMAAPRSTFKNDAEFWRTVMLNIVLPSELLDEALESKSALWVDDLHIIGTFVLKTIRQFALSDEGDNATILPKFKDDEDARFGAELFTYVVQNRVEYTGYIERFMSSGSWEPERVAFMDFVIMLTAIAEIINFPAIPIPVSLNEYIEIAKYYSTPNSGHFINGILFSVINCLKEEHKILKS